MRHAKFGQIGSFLTGGIVISAFLIGLFCYFTFVHTCPTLLPVVVETEHFRVHATNAKQAACMAAIAEHALVRIKSEILIDSPEIDSKVDVFIWPSQKDFHQAIASSDISNASVSQLILAENGRLMRRIDMAASAPAGFVLPHEITHLIIGQLDIKRRNNGQPAIPLALHEGIAILAEGKCNDELLMKAGMALDCIAGNGCESASESIARFDRLLNTNDYGMLSDSCNFYAESYSLVEYLMTELKPEGLSRLMTSLGDGLSIDAALQKAICDESDAFKHNLIKKWHAHARNNTSALIAMR